MTDRLTWIIGSGGLLGSAVECTLDGSCRSWRTERPIAWSNQDTLAQLSLGTAEFARAARETDWSVLWCAGAGVVGTQPAALAAETDSLVAVLGGLERARADGLHPGSFFLASSAGGVYAGSDAARPFTELSAVKPMADYGRNKLTQEGLTSDWASRTGARLLIGRIANLYGPGQDLSKPQGLISRLCLAQLLHLPMSIFVPMDTVRDYVYALDCGRLIQTAMGRLRIETPEGGHITKILASHEPRTVSSVLAEFRRVVRRSPRVVLGTSASAHLQVRDLRLRSVIWEELDKRPVTPLGVGIAETLSSMLLRAGSGELVATTTF